MKRNYSYRIPPDQQWNERESNTYWFIPSNQIPELIPANNIQVKIFVYMFIWKFSKLTLYEL